MRMRGAMPSIDSALLLLGSVAMKQKDAYKRKIGAFEYDKKFKWKNDEKNT
jgi:hypothetical protein